MAYPPSAAGTLFPILTLGLPTSATAAITLAEFRSRLPHSLLIAPFVLKGFEQFQAQEN